MSVFWLLKEFIWSGRDSSVLMTLEGDANREVRSGMKTRGRCREDTSLTLELETLYLINTEIAKTPFGDQSSVTLSDCHPICSRTLENRRLLSPYAHQNPWDIYCTLKTKNPWELDYQTRDAHP